MSSIRKQQIHALLKAIETGDEDSVAVVNPNKYIQHNPQTHEGGEGLAALFKRLSKSSPRVNIVRIFSDGDYVFAHTEYDFSSSRIGFEVFRFEGDMTVEHWDNIQPRKGPNPSGHNMVDGVTDVTDIEKTESNRELVRAFIDDILIGGQAERLSLYVDDQHFTEHNPRLEDGLAALQAALIVQTPDNGLSVRYKKLHRLLAQGNFVLSVCEGSLNGTHSSFYDLYRLLDDQLVEHWDTTEAIPPRSVWKNENGKF